jgi:hypothetical protein
MYRVPQAGLTKPAVAGQLERGVRHQACALRAPLGRTPLRTSSALGTKRTALPDLDGEDHSLQRHELSLLDCRCEVSLRRLR